MSNPLIEATVKVLNEHLGAPSHLEEQMAGTAKKDQLYAIDAQAEGRKYESHANHINSALKHAKDKGYKINHNGAAADIGKHEEHKKPDVTFHYQRGDDRPSAYTVHHEGSAANDSKLHKKAVHMGNDE